MPSKTSSLAFIIALFIAPTLLAGVRDNPKTTADPADNTEHTIVDPVSSPRRAVLPSGALKVPTGYAEPGNPPAVPLYGNEKVSGYDLKGGKNGRWIICDSTPGVETCRTAEAINPPADVVAKAKAGAKKSAQAAPPEAEMGGKTPLNSGKRAPGVYVKVHTTTNCYGCTLLKKNWSLQVKIPWDPAFEEDGGGPVYPNTGGQAYPCTVITKVDQDGKETSWVAWGPSYAQINANFAAAKK